MFVRDAADRARTNLCTRRYCTVAARVFFLHFIHCVAASSQKSDGFHDITVS